MNFKKFEIQATKEQAEQRLISLCYKNFHFKGMSTTNGASFYFEDENGKEIRVSDHPLTGKRAFTTIDISLFEGKKLGVKKAQEQPKFVLTPEIIAKAAARKAKMQEKI